MFKYCEPRLSKRLGLLLFACMFFVALGYAQNASAVVRGYAEASYQSGDYDILSQYGEWMNVSPYGDVWCPDVDSNWEPFYDGRWIRTSDGWAWDSYEPFGELVYHYGYWYTEPEIGWFWVPGDEWSPARVQWYTEGSYCGWAPMPPPNYYWPDPWDSYRFNVWIVVNINDFCGDHIGRYGIDRPHYRDMFRRTDFVRRGPDYRDVEFATGRRIPVQRIREHQMANRGYGRDRRDMGNRQLDPNQRQTYQSRRQQYASRRDAQPQQRQPYQSRRDIQPQQRQRYESRQNAQPQQRQRYESRQNAQPQQRQRYESRRDVQPQQRQRYESRRDVQPQQRQRNESRRDVQPQQRQRNESGQDVQPQQQRHESRQSARPERKTESSSKESDRDTGRRARRN